MVFFPASLWFASKKKPYDTNMQLAFAAVEL